MNRIHKSVWNEATGAWVATSETARSKTSRGTSRKLVMAQAVLAAAALMGGMSAAHADANAAALYFEATGAGTAASVSSGVQEALAAGDGALASALNAIAVGANSFASNTGSVAV